MEHALHLDIQAHILPGPIRITAEGCLTENSYHSLLRTCDHAIGLQGCPSICIDLLGLTHLEPAALQAVEHHIAQYQGDRELPTISIQARAFPQHCATSSAQGAASSQLPPATDVSELMSPLGPLVDQDQLLGEVSRVIRTHAEPAVVVDDDSHQPHMVITDTDLEAVAHQNPEGWQTKSCRSLTACAQGYVRPEHLVEGVVWEYQHDQIQPLLVFNGREAVGVLHPSAVLQWCAEHWPAVLNTLNPDTPNMTSNAQTTPSANR